MEELPIKSINKYLGLNSEIFYLSFFSFSLNYNVNSSKILKNTKFIRYFY